MHGQTGMLTLQNHSSLTPSNGQLYKQDTHLPVLRATPQDATQSLYVATSTVRHPKPVSLWELQVGIIVLFSGMTLLGICQLLGWTLLTWLDRQSAWPR